MAVSVTQPTGMHVLPESRMITNSVMSSARMALIYRNTSNNLAPDVTIGHVVDVVVGSSNPSSIIASFVHLEAMITEDCGVMKCRKKDQEDLVACYFELKDINVPSKKNNLNKKIMALNYNPQFLQGLKELKELTQVIENPRGTASASCEIVASTDASVPYKVASFQILGDLPHHLLHLSKETAKKMTEEPYSEKEARFRRLVQLYKVGSVAWRATSLGILPSR